jgi:hypothetical protein
MLFTADALVLKACRAGAPDVLVVASSILPLILKNIMLYYFECHHKENTPRRESLKTTVHQPWFS